MASKTLCPISRQQFRDHAKPMEVTIAGVPLIAEVKEFSTGSLGWYLNGKTTVTWMVRSILKQAGYSAGVLGTVEYHDGAHSEPAGLTTPRSRTLQQWLARMAEQCTTHAAIELSSHALEQRRAAGTVLRAAAVTNITQDHFDYHKTFDAYRSSKSRIAELLHEKGLQIARRTVAKYREQLQILPARLRRRVA